MPGTLKAVGLVNGKEAAEYHISTPGKATSFQLEINDCGRHLKADGADVIFVYAKVVDKNGNLCIDSKIPVTVKLSGDAKLAGPATVNAEAGIAAFLLQAGTHAGNIEVTATARDLQSGAIEIKSSK